MAATASVPQIRERVLQLAREIEEFSRSDVPPELFFREFLRRLTTAVGGEAGAVWLVDDANRLTLAHEVRLADTGFFAEPQAMQRNQALVSEALQNGQARCLNPSDPTSVELPTNHQLILATLGTGSKPLGVVEIFQRPDSPQSARLGYMQFVEQMAGYASRYLERREKPRAEEGRGPLLDEFARLVLELQRTLKVDEVASTAANDGRVFLKCDRVGVIVNRGKKAVVQAVTGQESINRRANLVRQMSALAKQVMKTGEPLVFTGNAENLPPAVEKPLAHFVQESGSRMVILVPLHKPEPLVAREDEKKDGAAKKKKAEKRSRPLGCLVVEQFTESEPTPGLRERIDLMTDHVAVALQNARSHQQIFLLSFWQLLGRGLEWFYGRKLMKTLAVLAVIAAIVGSLAFIPWDYRVEGQGKLMPVVQYDVFAPLNGEVEEIFVRGNERVKKGQLLLRLRNDELREQVVRARSDLALRQQTEVALFDRIDAARGQLQEMKDLQGQLAQTRTEILGLQEYLKVLEERFAKLEVRAPNDGVVPTFQVEQMLRNRPVQMGEVLLEVMDDTGPWRLELEVGENRMGHLIRGQKKLGTGELPVEFILATAPEHTYRSKLQAISTRSNESAENGAIVEAFCSIEPQQLPPNPRIGAEVRAKISCGERSLGYVLFGDVVEFLQKHLWL